MNKECLELSLGKVNDAHDHGEGLELGCWLGRAINEGATEIHEWVDEEGSKILDDENGSPGDLGSCKFHQSKVQRIEVLRLNIPRSLTSIALLFLTPVS